SQSQRTNETKIPVIKWAKNDYELTWALLTQLELPANHTLFFGKANKSDNTTGDTKLKVTKCIAEVLFPAECKISATAMGHRVRQKVEQLFTTYKLHVKCLRCTGEGVGDKDNVPSEPTHDFYVTAQGPDENTPQEAVNIWEEIIAEFPFFPQLH
ncbi:hypothetical protein BDQ17DRAFT_1222666, partial [Cyathus striatus]